MHAISTPLLAGSAPATRPSQFERLVAPAVAPEQVALTRRVRFQRITMDSGLSHSLVRTIAEDRRGFVWFGTSDGLNRFDGYRMTVFRHDPLLPNSLSSSLVVRIREDQQGMLWLAHASAGVTRFNPVDETFQRYRHDPENRNSLAGDVIYNIFQDRLGRLWFSGPPVAGGLTRFDPTTERFTRIEMQPDPGPEAYQGGVIWDAIDGDEGQMWLAADFLVEELEPETGRFTHYLPSGTERRLGSIVKDDEGTVWAGGVNGIYRVDRATKQLVRQDLAVSRVTSMVVDEQGLFWVGTHEGLCVIDRRMERIVQHYTHETRDRSTLSSPRIRDLMWSRGGLLWIATEQGISTYRPSQTRFLSFGLPWDDSTVATGTRKLSAGPDQNLWITHQRGIAKVDLESRAVQKLDFVSILGDGLPATAIYADSHDRVWFSNGELIHRWDVPRSQLSSVELPRAVPEDNRLPPKGPPAAVAGFEEDAAGTVWITAVRAGLFYWDDRSNALEPLRPVQAIPSPRGSPGPLHLATTTRVSRAGTLWVGTQVGELFEVDPHTRRVIHVFAPSDYPSLPATQINAIQQDQQGDLWLGTGAGLVHARLDEETFTLYGHGAGLESPVVESVLRDDDGRLWLGTRKGLVRFDPESEKFRRFDADDGLPGNTFLSGAWLSQTSSLAFADSGGFTMFRPRRLTESAYQPPLLLTSFQLMYEAQHPGEGGILNRPIWDTSRVELDHHQNVFGFEFAALDYVSPNKNRYRYRLEGFDESWHEVDSTQRFATYTHVPPGEYGFRVERRSSDGRWHSGGASIQLTVKRPWWMTPWARGGAGLALFTIVFGWHRARLSRIRKQNLLLEEKVIDRTAALEDANRRLELAATTDPLTGVPNRRYYVDRAGQELAKLRRTGRTLTVALADIDDFKQVNDAFGHDFGDQVIKRVAELVRAQVREQDIVARWGGEEFILLFPETDASGATVVAEKIRAGIEACSFDANGQQVRVTLTIGLAEVSKSETVEGSTARADEALYKGKRCGKNCVVTALTEARVSDDAAAEEDVPPQVIGVRASVKRGGS